ncbi:hypothetical protein [Nonomuraea dietziae]|uniref:Uncharacterized protein n=1 Tax=Nonomuraea dietziae TaxID=65515 RepID=A0A7W5YQ21_9ACTN|nr:hypothetical protein [Nonomuraea dietziae]MBB3725814.1 hypothetical protein [Nonomuraea dietziae]
MSARLIATILVVLSGPPTATARHSGPPGWSEPTLKGLPAMPAACSEVSLGRSGRSASIDSATVLTTSPPSSSSTMWNRPGSRSGLGGSGRGPSPRLMGLPAAVSCWSTRSTR